MAGASKNQRTGDKDVHITAGPCVDCGATDPRGLGPFTVNEDPVKAEKEAAAVAIMSFVPLRRHTSTGKMSMVRLCQSCAPR